MKMIRRIEVAETSEGKFVLPPEFATLSINNIKKIVNIL